MGMHAPLPFRNQNTITLSQLCHIYVEIGNAWQIFKKKKHYSVTVINQCMLDSDPTTTNPAISVYSILSCRGNATASTGVNLLGKDKFPHSDPSVLEENHADLVVSSESRVCTLVYIAEAGCLTHGRDYISLQWVYMLPHREPVPYQLFRSQDLPFDLSFECPTIDPMYRTIRKVNLPHPRQNLRIFQHSYTNVVNCHYWFFIYTHMFTYKYVAHRRQKCTSYYQWQLSSNQKPLLPCKLPPLSIYLSILLNRLGHRKPTLQKTNTCTTLSQLSICDTFSYNIGSYLSAKSWVMHARQVSRKQNTTTLLQITTRRAREHKNTK